MIEKLVVHNNVENIWVGSEGLLKRLRAIRVVENSIRHWHDIWYLAARRTINSNHTEGAFFPLSFVEF